MSFGGILAQALAGGTAAIGKQAGDDLEAQRRAEMMRQQADIEEQMRMRLADFSERQRRSGALWDTTGEGGAAKLDLARRTGEQANDIAIKGKVAEATNPELLAAEDVRADAELQRKIKAGKALLPLEIERASRLAAADAGTRARYREKAPTMADKAAELEAFLGRKLLPEERERMSGLTKGRDPETGYETVEQREYDANGQEVRKTTRKEPIRAGQGGGKPTEQQAHAEAEAAIKSGAPRDAVNARLAQAGFKPLGGSSDKPGMTPGAERAARTKPAADYRPASDGSGRMVDVTTGRTLTPEQSAILQKMQRGEPTTPRERAMLAD